MTNKTYFAYLKYSGGQKADSRSPDKANATTSVIYPLPPQMAHNLTQSEPSGLKMGIRRDNILAPKDDPRVLEWLYHQKYPHNTRYEIPLGWYQKLQKTNAFNKVCVTYPA